jgi:hypothetical protein
MQQGHFAAMITLWSQFHFGETILEFCNAEHYNNNGKWEYGIMYDSCELTQYNSVWLILP